MLQSGSVAKKFKEQFQSSSPAVSLRRRAPWLRRAETEAVLFLSLRDARSRFTVFLRVAELLGKKGKGQGQDAGLGQVARLGEKDQNRTS